MFPNCIIRFDGEADPAAALAAAIAGVGTVAAGPIGLVIAAVAMGADVIEKHFTLDKNMEGPDHKVSIEPGELQYLVKSIRKIEAALGDGKKIPTIEENEVAKLVRKSIFAKDDIAANEEITKDKLEIKRPGNGLPPSSLHLVIGEKTKEVIKAGTQITLEQII